MLAHELETYFSHLLSLDRFTGVDASMNGLQVGIPEAPVVKVAFAVDACMESFRRAVEAGCNVLFVHHGLFWGKPVRVSGSHYTRLKFLMDNEMHLLAAHLPLDQHPEFGNNACLVKTLGLLDVEPFGEYKGIKIGYKGRFAEAQDISAVLRKCGLTRETARSVLPFGPEAISTVGVISGGAAFDVFQALEEGLDLYITGEETHSVYHTCMEEGIHMISGGHYNTEVWGVRALSRKLAEDTGLGTVFIDIPSGL